jgi:hypothetical protein
MLVVVISERAEVIEGAPLPSQVPGMLDKYRDHSGDGLHAGLVRQL